MQKVIGHDLDKAKAKKVIDKAVAEYTGKYPQYKPSFEWLDHNTAKLSLTAMGATITAGITLNDSNVTVDLEVPKKFKLFEGAAMKAIDEEVQKWLKKAKSDKI